MAHNDSHNFVMTTLFDSQIRFVRFLIFVKLMSHGSQAEAMSFLQDGLQESLGPRGPVAVPQDSRLQGKHNPQAENKAPQAPKACTKPINNTAFLEGEIFACSYPQHHNGYNGALVFHLCSWFPDDSLLFGRPAPRGLDRR